MPKRFSREIHDVMKWSARCREHFFPWRLLVEGQDQESPLAEAGITEAYPGYELGRTHPRFHLLVYPTHGRGLVHTVEREAAVERGQVLILPAGLSFGYRPARARWRFLWFHLPDEEPWRHLRRRRFVVRKTGLTVPLEHAMDELLRESRGKSASARRAARLLADLVAVYVAREAGEADESLETDMQDRLHRLWDVVHGDLVRPWTVEDLASEVGVSAPHLYRLTRHYHDCSPMKMVTRLRMEQAQELLIMYDDSIATVSDRVGYQNEFAFSVAFKRFSGVTPGQFRKRR